jgi:hypothetical protein
VKTPGVAIIVINLNGRDDTLKCLASLDKVKYPNLKIYLVDNGSTQPIADDVRRLFPKVILIQNAKNMGFTGGNNIGIKKALKDKAEYVCLLNNDTIVNENFLEPLIKVCEGNPAIGMATPKIYFYGSSNIIWAYGAKVDKTLARSPHIGVGEKDRKQFDKIRFVERITGCAMFVKKEVIEKIGMLDDRFFIYEEELDWCLRARRLGYKLAVVPESIIWHKGHRDSGRIGRPFIGYLQTRNHFLMLKKNRDYFRFGGFVAILYAGLVIFKEVVKSLFFAGLDKRYSRYAGAVIKGVLDFLRGRYGEPDFLEHSQN